MHRALSALLLLLVPAATRAQAPFVAPTSAAIEGRAEATSAVAPLRRFVVANRSSVPVIVYSLTLSSCVNVRQPCGTTLVHVAIPPSGRAEVGRVEAKDRARRFTYDWTYEFHPDTSDARVMTLLRANGAAGPPAGRATNVAVQDSAPTLASTGTGTSRDPLTPAERRRTVVALDANNRPVRTSERFRFRVAPGSILASASTPGVPVATGACISPSELAMHQRDTTITSSPAVPPRLNPTSITLPSLPPGLLDSTAGDASVLMRWVVDTTGAAIPGSVSVLASGHGPLSVRLCGAAIAAWLTPGRDAAGRFVRAWVELPIIIRR